MDFEDLFQDISNQMRSDFSKAQKSLTHSGLKGNANEETVRGFLRRYHPKNLDISTGMIVDSDGETSKQLDVIISDATKTPILFESGETRVIPAECVYAVIEVKAYLDKQELEKAHANMKSVKSLKKEAYFTRQSVIYNVHNLYGKEWEHWPPQHFVFAFDSPDINTVVKNIISLNDKEEVHQRIDSVCILDKGVILNKESDGKFSALPSSGSRMAVSYTDKPLLLFYTLMSVKLNQANMNPFNILPYLSKLKF